jgi:hypothetical protein
VCSGSIQILSKAAGSDFVLKVPVGGGHHPHINAYRLAAADRVDLALLQHPQQLDLHVQRQVADFIEEDGAAVGQLEAANPVGHGPGESPLAVTEELAFNQILGNGRTVDGHKIATAPLRLLMQGSRHQLFAGATFASNHDGGRRIGHPCDHGPHCQSGLALADERVTV